MKNLTMLFAVLLCLVAVPMFAANPGGGNMECNNITLSSTTVASNLHVPAGAVCTMYWVEVQGNVTVEGTLISFSSKFDMNVTVTGAVSFINNYQKPLIGKNLSITNSSGQSGIYSSDSYPVINGNVSISGLQPGGWFTFSAGSTTVNGGISVTNNLAPVHINDTTIGKSLDCSGNNPAPTGNGNVVATGGKTGQCSAL
jgi:hypothetical protein